MVSPRNLSILSTMRGWWRESLARNGFWPTAQTLVRNLWEFLVESTPAQRHQRYGDAEYDWDHRVNTTSATVSWRERLLGQFHSAYQPTEPGFFREMMEMMESLKINFQEFTFIDVGSGKGRVLLMATDYPFRRILGIELLPDLHRIAQENIGIYKSESQRCFAVEAVFGDVREFVFPAEPIVLYLFNPLPEAGLIDVITNLERSLENHPRTTYVLYHNPLLEHVLKERVTFTKIGGTHQYSLFRAGR